MSKNRSPIVTILGHVDHGKTTLLDSIRKSKIASGEHGGITQRIGGYEIKTKISGYDNDVITFIDTPGHEAFSKLRSRGATVADIAILIIDAVDSVMPQTIESIAHIKEAKIPYIVAINKIDLPGAKPEKVKKDLLKYEVVTEGLGGEVPTVLISASKNEGITELLESLLLISSEIDLKYDPKNPVQAYIIETNKDRRGTVVSAIIKDGSLHVGDTVYTNSEKIRIRALINDLGKQVIEVEPSTPFEILGFSNIPEVGSQITAKEQEIKKFKSKDDQSVPMQVDMETLLGTSTPEAKKLPVVLKADSHGTLEAILNALKDNDNIEIILSTVGGIHRSDIFLAKSTKAIVIGFSTTVNNEVKILAKQEKVVVKTYEIIYELLDELEEVSELIHEKEENEKNLKAQANILATFVLDGENAVGGLVTKGKVNIGDNVEVYRNNKLIGKTKLISLRIRAKTVQEVKKDQEFGMQTNPVLDIKQGDVVKFIL
ncbi:translation initiation factor IF-2 [Candidatus Roizmanbacteria bacterium CG_4_10_14_0_2_um_filter_36_9]|uniref:Translation initiation factor IF-2 n=1 Tax=Candidatus Roizmanbacteria bacterium CG_4_10_14_0_2_um_filter_36_9 TaxID=1974823 RepID=A0A2M7U3I8_9BACT|nr:MAG: translation initiation factor IF-2 [Candidatus Roizmanbacteria bacterium CG_4_10_14_0_2_um_filter_36_9]